MTDIQEPGADTSGETAPGSRVGLVLLIAGIVLLGVLGSVSAVVVVIALLVMIFMHELGHYLTAKSAGMKVTEFFLGFGPRIWSFRKGETEYGLKAIPAGAYVRIIGMHNLDPVAPEDEARAYKNKPYWRKMSVASAGSMMHFIMAAVLMFTLFATYGQRDPDNVWTVGSLSRLGDTQTSPAIEAGIQVGDRIVAIDGIPVDNFDQTVDLIQARPGQTVTIEVERDGQTFETTATLNDHNPEGRAVGFLGVGARYPYVNQTIPEAAKDTAVAFKDLTWGTIRALGSFFSPSGLSDYIDTLRGQPSGSDASGSGSGASQGDRPLSPVGAVRIASQAADAGIAELLWFLVVINMFVGIFNLVPLLPLDGGHIAIGTYEKIRSRKGKRYQADVAKLMPLTYGVVLFMVFVFVSALWLDLADPLHNPFGQ